MKRAAIAVVVLLLLAALCVLSAGVLRRTGTHLYREAGEIEQAAERGDFALARSAYQTFYIEWERAEPTLLLLSGRHHTTPVPVCLARIESCLEQEKSSELLIELSELKAYLKLAWETHTKFRDNLF